MQKLWGFGAVIGLTGLLVGCQPATNRATRTVQSTNSTITAVQRVSTTDFAGRWVSPTPATSLYLNAHHQMALFRQNQHTIRGRFAIKMINNQATVTVVDHHPIKLDLDGANTMTMRQNNTTIKLTKDPNWSAQRSDIPATNAVALKKSSLTPAFKPSY
ncbi:hypothetical protein D1831_06705 [Lactiplantibacillus garii]|uniref:Lipoprotein n=1 Tax=Lactiplantibacillus garii TaxID=2306423 RepID=A0A3R8J7C2_9LACO|nr:hypothetical protein [Lactiplantibacillus garii]RRK10545.1 hypothetical protein D1831_06705 [Lactiplantibacillus garii]